MTTKWKKPNGTILELNDEKATIEAAAGLGWKPIKDLDKEKLVKPVKAVIKE